MKRRPQLGLKPVIIIFHHKKVHVLLPLDICQGYGRNEIIICRCCPVAMTYIIDVSWFRNVNPSKESMSAQGHIMFTDGQWIEYKTVQQSQGLIMISLHVTTKTKSLKYLVQKISWYAAVSERLKPIRDRHFGIAGPWTCVLDPDMLDSGPKFPEISVQKHTKFAASKIFRP